MQARGDRYTREDDGSVLSNEPDDTPVPSIVNRIELKTTTTSSPNSKSIPPSETTTQRGKLDSQGEVKPKLKLEGVDWTRLAEKAKEEWDRMIENTMVEEWVYAFVTEFEEAGEHMAARAPGASDDAINFCAINTHTLCMTHHLGLALARLKALETK
jgi:hypothetical protein